MGWLHGGMLFFEKNTPVTTIGGVDKVTEQFWGNKKGLLKIRR